MATDINYAFEEYKMLKDEAKSLTDHGFRDLQILIGLLAICFGILNNERYESIKDKGYALLQIIVFVFLIAQCSKLSYVLVIRSHLQELESIINQQTNNLNDYFGRLRTVEEANTNKLRWETEVVSKKFFGFKIPSTLAQFVLGCSYYLIFVTLCILSLVYLDYENLFSWFYIVVLICEIATLGYLTWQTFLQYLKFFNSANKLAR